MNAIIINQFIGTHTVTLPQPAAKYVELYSSDGSTLTDSNIMTVESDSTSVYVTINSDNIEASQFPLNLVYFYTNEYDLDNAVKPFDQPNDTPTGNDLFAIGKRGRSAKNVPFSSLSDYTTDGGECWIKKSSNLGNIQPNEARDNLQIYSRSHVDNLRESNFLSQNMFYTNGVEDTPKNCPICWAAGDFDPSDYSPANYTFETSMVNGVIHCRFIFTKVYALKFINYSPFCILSDIQTVLFDNPNITPPNTIVMQATVYKSGKGLPVDGGWYHGEYDPDTSEWVAVLDSEETFPNVTKFPQLVMTGNTPFLYRNGNLQENKIYVVDTRPTPNISHWFDFYREIALYYECSFVPSDTF